MSQFPQHFISELLAGVENLPELCDDNARISHTKEVISILDTPNLVCYRSHELDDYTSDDESCVSQISTSSHASCSMTITSAFSRWDNTSNEKSEDAPKCPRRSYDNNDPSQNGNGKYQKQYMQGDRSLASIARHLQRSRSPQRQQSLQELLMSQSPDTSTTAQQIESAITMTQLSLNDECEGGYQSTTESTTERKEELTVLVSRLSLGSNAA